MVDVTDALTMRARKILQVKKEAGISINRDNILQILRLDAPARLDDRQGDQRRRD